MLCRQCRAEIPAGSTFCNLCGSPQSQAEEPAQPFAPGAERRPGAATAPTPEETIWRGRYSARASGLQWILWLLWVIALALAWFVLPVERDGWIDVALAVAAVLPAAYLAARIVLRKLTISYRLTTHRFFRHRGLLSRRIDELELIRVDDVAVAQNVVQRMFDVGTVTVLSTDPTDPRMLVEGIAHPVSLKEEIRTQVRARRQRTTFLETL